MALLTEEQVEDVMAMFDCYASGRYKKSFEYDFGEWNKKQQPTQFEPDWSNAPDYAVGAAISLAWVTESGNWGFGGNIARFDKPAPAVTPHPHAEIMAKYAEVAARRVDPWVEFEFKHKTNENWVVFICHPHFAVDYEYRHIGDGK